MIRSALTLVAAALVMVGCDTPPAAPEMVASVPSLYKEGQPAHENFRAPFTRTVSNPCPPVPEPVLVEGYLHYNSHFKFFPGGNQARIQTNSNASGVGAVTGVGYQFHELFRSFSTYTYANSRLEAEQDTRFHVISQTDLGNFFATMKTKMVCTPEGGCTSVVVEIETDCRG